jgi:hypothetical protein
VTPGAACSLQLRGRRFTSRRIRFARRSQSRSALAPVGSVPPSGRPGRRSAGDASLPPVLKVEGDGQANEHKGPQAERDNGDGGEMCEHEYSRGMLFRVPHAIRIAVARAPRKARSLRGPGPRPRRPYQPRSLCAGVQTSVDDRRGNDPSPGSDLGKVRAGARTWSDATVRWNRPGDSVGTVVRRAKADMIDIRSAPAVAGGSRPC